MSTTYKVRLGFIGVGWWATVNHLPILRARPDVELVGICGLDAAVLAAVQQQFDIPFSTRDVGELLRQKLDGVVISSPHALHYQHAKLALEAGFHVLCEKPMTLRASEAWELVEIARRQNREILVPYGWHYKPFMAVARQWMAEHLIGKIEYAECRMASPTLGLFAGNGEVPDTWAPTLAKPDMSTWQVKAKGGGYAHGQITHSSALLFWLTGLRVAEVSCRMLNAGAGVDLYDAATVQFTNGAIGTISGAGTLPDNSDFQVELQLFGELGTLRLDLERELLQLRRRDGRIRTEPIPKGIGAYSCEGPPNRFVDLIKGKAANDSPGELAACTVELIEAMHVSADENRPVTVTNRRS